MKETITDFYGRILGYIETKSNGDLEGRDFYGRIIGYYIKRENVTKDFYYRTVSNGNTLSALIIQNNNGNK